MSLRQLLGSRGYDVANGNQTRIRKAVRGEDIRIPLRNAPTAHEREA
jgi:hypothetical protein